MRNDSWRRRAGWASVLLLCCTTVASAADENPDFESEVAPLLVRRCVECHNAKDPAGGLVLTTRAGLLAGGESGEVVSLEDVEESYLLQRVVDGEMPPQKQGRSQQLPDDEIQLLRRWLSTGAAWPAERTLDLFERTTDLRAGRDWWALQPVTRPALPSPGGNPWSKHPIDAFVFARLQQQGLTPAPRADKRTLLRRAYYDMIGLPPTHEQVVAFLEDDSPQAWERVIDQLLASPHYGERWGRYWLDLARYANTSGYERDQEKPFAWKYRDWVVNALNQDMPFEQFVIEQLAGDEIENRTIDSVIATGFLRLGTWNDEPNQPLDYQFDRLEDLVHTTSAAFLGLTVKCARCHAHKFDPIEQEDYYRMAAAFWAGPIAPRDRSLLGGPTAEEVGFEQVLAWTDVGPDPPPLHLLKDGERLKPREVVQPGSLSTIPALARTFDPPPSGSATSHRRLQLARWLADPRNPLPPRVLVNRLWQHHFGKGIVRTPNNLGFLADPPTHPDLLDWLASEFLEGGARMKRIHKLILTSETWQQASVHPEHERYLALDATNRLWWHAERRRLDAESLRDSLLLAAGELDLRIGGESFRPTISKEALEGLSRKEAAWQASPLRLQNRRSLYMYLKRGLLPPMMTTFDLADATQSCGQRDVTIVPTQALALLNHQFVHERSQNLALELARTHPDRDDRIRHAWLRVLKREPTREELALSQKHLQAQITNFAQGQTANQPDPAPPTLESIESRLQLHLRADQVTVAGNESRVQRMQDLSGRQRHATQPDQDAQPILVSTGLSGRPALRFDGKGRFLHIAGPVLEEQECTIVCVVTDEGTSGHRAIVSNWNRSGNSTSSLFLGLTGETTVRFSDAFSDAGEVADRGSPFILTAVNGSDAAAVYQNGRLLRKSGQLSPRRLGTPWVIGQQGNIDGEYWTGLIGEIRIYDQALSESERRTVEQALANRYGLDLASTAPTQAALSTGELALASLCQVLMNSNEFLFVD